MKVLITGADGFVGRNLVSDFAARGYAVNAAARKRIADMPKGVEWIAAPSLCNGADFSAAVSGCGIVVHAAARVHIMNDTKRDPLAEFMAVNVAGTIALARAAVAAGVRHLVFLSSVKVNGEGTHNGQRFTATDLSNPQDPYAVSKAEAEKALLEIAAESDMAVTIVRPVLVYGAGVKGNFRTMMAAIARGLPLPLGGINNRRSLVYVRNLTDFIVRLVEYPDAHGKILLVSDGNDLSTSDLLRMIGRGLNRPARLLPVPPAIQRLSVAIAGDNSAASRLFGSLQVDHSFACDAVDWSPPFTVEQGIAETAADYRASLGL
jgi:nucleoside-diphosphate-sugar epimerase